MRVIAPCAGAGAAGTDETGALPTGVLPSPDKSDSRNWTHALAWLLASDAARQTCKLQSASASASVISGAVKFKVGATAANSTFQFSSHPQKDSPSLGR